MTQQTAVRCDPEFKPPPHTLLAGTHRQPPGAGCEHDARGRRRRRQCNSAAVLPQGAWCRDGARQNRVSDWGGGGSPGVEGKKTAPTSRAWALYNRPAMQPQPLICTAQTQTRPQVPLWLRVHPRARPGRVQRAGPRRPGARAPAGNAVAGVPPRRDAAQRHHQRRHEVQGARCWRRLTLGPDVSRARE